jgi:hypothetical protein
VSTADDSGRRAGRTSPQPAIDFAREDRWAQEVVPSLVVGDAIFLATPARRKIGLKLRGKLDDGAVPPPIGPLPADEITLLEPCARRCRAASCGVAPRRLTMSLPTTPGDLP